MALLGLGPTAEFALKYLQQDPPLTNPQWKTSNVIILLTGGQTVWQTINQSEAKHVSPQGLAISRLVEAAHLYLDCKSQGKICSILVTGGDPTSSGESEAAAMANVLKQIGISSADIILETQSRNTFENALYSVPIIKLHNFEYSVLVTAGFHIRRADICFRLNGLITVLAPADQLRPNDTYFPDSLNLSYINLALHEYAGIIKAYIQNAFGGRFLF